LNGTLVAGSNSININPASSLEISGFGDFGAIPFSGSTSLTDFTLYRIDNGLVSLDSDLTVTGMLTQYEGAINLNGHTLTVEGDYEGIGNIQSTNESSMV